MQSDATHQLKLCCRTHSDTRSRTNSDTQQRDTEGARRDGWVGRQLGDGFKLAKRDMQIRGVGAIFGLKQSGDVDDVGEDLYLETLYTELDNVEKQVSSAPGSRPALRVLASRPAASV